MSLNLSEKRILSGIALLFALVVANSSVFIVDESEYAVELRFGRVISVIDKPGLHAKWPAPIGQVRRFDKRVLYRQVPETEFLSSDKKNITVASFLTWHIASPRLFLESMGNREAAEVRLETLVKSSLGSALGNSAFSDYIPESPTESSPEEAGGNLLALEKNVFDGVKAIAKHDYGIELVSFGVSRFGFPQQNIKAVFSRMKAERERIASAYRSEGAANAKKILANAERERREILAKAQAESSILLGKSEAEATIVYSKAYASDPEFYQFLRKLETYKKVIDDKTTLIIPADSKLIDLLVSEE